MRAPLLVLTVLALAGCGGEGRSGTPATSEDPGGGNATYCAASSLRSIEASAVRQFNRAHRDDGYTARFEVYDGYGPLPDVCDVALIDSARIAGYAEAGSLADLTEHVDRRRDDFVGNTLELSRYAGRQWGLPRLVDVGFVYYKHAAGTPPLTWQEAYALARRRGGFVYAGSPKGYSLVAHFLEVAYAAGGSVLSEDGTASALDSAENLRALTLMRRAIERGAVPRAVLGMDERAARLAFADRATLMRDWTATYTEFNVDDWRSDSQIIELPAFGDGEPTAVIAGLLVAVAADARTEPAALALADYLTGPQEAERLPRRFKMPTALTATFEPPSIHDFVRYHAEFERELQSGRPHPVTPNWPAMARAIERRVHAALGGRLSPREALLAAHDEVNALLSG